MTATRVLVTGAGGFIGHHLVTFLVKRGYWVRGVDLRLPEYETSFAHEFVLQDLRRWDECLVVTRGIEEVYHLAADMGGIGYIAANRAAIARSNVVMMGHVLEAVRLQGVRRLFYSSSARVYPQYLQASADVTPLKEEAVMPADPEEGYGWEKLFSEKLCQYYAEDYGMQIRVARFHNIYGPLGTYSGGKESALSAICRKVALAADGDAIEVWGDGQQTRSFMYVGDCVEGIYRLMRSDHRHPLNIGTDRLVTVDELVDLVCRIAGKHLPKHHDLTKPQGVRGRNSDNSRLRETLRWEPVVTLEEGLTRTYRWIEAELLRSGERLPARPTTVRTGDDATQEVRP